MYRHPGNALDSAQAQQRPSLRDRTTALKTRFLAFLLIFAAACMSAPSWARDVPYPAAQAELETLNSDFRALYHERTRQVLEALPLVLVVQNSTITAVRGAQRRLYPVPLQRYNEARAIVHAALGFHGLMGSLAHAGEGADWARVESFLLHLERTRLAAEHSTLIRAEKAQAAQVLDILRRASSEALAKRTIDENTIASTLRHTEPLLLAMTDSVGQAHAEAMLAVLRRIQSDATEQEWQNVVAVVTGPTTPRRNNLETAITAAALGAQHLGSRIFYSENIFSVDGALAYLQTLVGDRELSQHVFGTPHRMWEDLFTPVSRKLVEQEFYTELAQ